MHCGVYKITNLLNNRNYIGVSIHIEERWEQHKKGKGNKELYADIKKYGIENFSFSIIEICDEEQMYKKEPYWIKVFEGYSKGYNKNLGGDTANLQAVEKTKKPIYCYDLNGNFIKRYDSLSEAERDTGVPNTNISRNAKGKVHKAGPFQWRYEYFSKIPPYKRTINFKNKPKGQAKSVLQYSKNGIFIKEYPSGVEAAKQTKTNASSLRMCCNGQRKTAGGYIWRFKEEK